MDTRRHRPFHKAPPRRRRRYAPGRTSRMGTFAPLTPDSTPDHDGADDVAAPPAPRRRRVDALREAPVPARARVPQQRRARVPLTPTIGVALVATVLAGSALVITKHDEAAGAVQSARASSAFDPPVPVAADTEYVRSRVLASGTVRVDHWIRSTSPLRRLALRVPSGAASGAVHRLAVVAGGHEIATPTTLQGRVRRLSFTAARTVHVDYLLRGVTRRTSDGEVTVTSLRLFSHPLTRTRVVAVLGARVTGLTCALRGAVPALCGHDRSERWSVTLRGTRRTARVSAELS